ncbi:MAG: PH domain-containing protein [Methanobacteriaceae archaeon]|nr:PH domain-containing protein [Methanobacteriaceae archaeon]MDP2836044.1 PH domain-containing protein [Methanobacteriaceae archaeon]MDP3624361.1 PH domain-containing protein [Methanobacteriaceae archaeon]
MFGRSRKSYHAGERVLSRCRPRIFLHSKSAIIKIIFFLILVYFFRPVVNLAVIIQNQIINTIKVPLVEATVMIMFGLMLLLILWAIMDIVSWKYTEYQLTTIRIITKRGIFSKKRAYVYYDKIEDISIYQSFLERMLSSGDIEVFSGHENTHVVLSNVPHPEILEDKINQIMEGDWKSFRSKNSRKNYYNPEKSFKKKLSFSDPEFWETEKSSDKPEIKPVQKEDENSPKKEKHVMERHAERFKRR